MLKKLYHIIVFSIALAVIARAQWSKFDKSFNIRPLEKKTFVGLNVSNENESDLPTLLKRIDLIANSNGKLSSPRFIFKGNISGSEDKIMDPQSFAALIDSASLSSVSPDDDGQFYVSCKNADIANIAYYSANIRYPEIEIRFGRDDEGLAIDLSRNSMPVIKVPFTVWCLCGTPADTTDDIQLLPTVMNAVYGDTSGFWGIRNSVSSPWGINPAKQSDFLDIYSFKNGKSYADLQLAWERQNTTGHSDPMLFYELNGLLFIPDVTINSLDSNPLSTINNLNGLTRPKPGTIIRFTYAIGLKLFPYTINAVVGRDISYNPHYFGFPSPQIQVVQGPAGMSVDEDNKVHWMPTINDTGEIEFSLSATNYRGSVEALYKTYIDALPMDFKDHKNNMNVSVFNRGLIGGFACGYENGMGNGISYLGKNGVYTAGIFLALSPDKICGKPYMFKDSDFMPLTSVKSVESPIPNTNQAFSTVFNDHHYNRETGKIGVTITQNSYSSDTNPLNNFIILDYTIHNDNNYRLDSLYFSAYADYDIGDFNNNLSGWDASRKLAYMYSDQIGDSLYYYGIALLKGNVSGFTDHFLSDGEQLYNQLKEIVEPDNVANEKGLLLSTGPYRVDSRSSFRVVYAIVAGRNLQELLTNTDYARQVNLDFDAATITFQVDMSVQEEIGVFQPDSGDMVVLRGSFNDWSGEQKNKYRLENVDESMIYKLPVMINKAPGEEVEYKFVIVSSDSVDKKEEKINCNDSPNCARFFTMTGEAQTLPVMLFNNATVTQSDSLALLEIYDSMYGDNWLHKDNWLSDQPIDNWYGVTVTDGRVTALNLAENGLAGAIPPDIGSLSALKILFMNNNDGILGNIPPQLYNLTDLIELHLNADHLSGELSEDIGKLKSLRVLDLGQNEFYSVLPENLGNLFVLEILNLSGNNFEGGWPEQLLRLTNLKVLSVAENNLTGIVPAEINELNRLTELHINGNNFDTLPPLSALSTLKWLLIQENKFTFKDIVPNLTVPSDTIVYAPQDSVGMAKDTLVSSGEDLSLVAPGEEANNRYQWYKNDQLINGASNKELILNQVTSNDEGIYHCQITNTKATDLTLYSRPVNVTIKTSPLIEQVGSLNDIRATYAKLSAYIFPADNNVNVKFLYGKNSVNENETLFGNNPISGNINNYAIVELSGLQPNTEYRWQVEINYDGGSDRSDERTFKTLPLPETISSNGTVFFPQHPSAADYTSDDYRLLGLPGNGGNLRISDILQGEPEKDWIAYWDNGEQSDYLIKYNETNIFKLEQGKAFWVVCKKPLNIAMDVPQAQLDSKDAAAIPLHDGWNIITNPLNITVSWDDIKNESGIGGNNESLWKFNVGWEGSDRMEPNMGYYFFNGVNLQVLKVPLKAMATMKKLNVLADTSFIAIDLNVNDTYNDKILFAVNDNVENLIIHKPRTVGGMNGIYYLKPQWDEKYPAFMADVRKSGEPLYDVPFYVTLASPKKAALHFNGINNIDENAEIYLVDLETATYQNLRETDSYSFSNFSKTRSFKLLIGRIDKIESELQKIVPHEFTLENNYPNPFNPETVIPVKIPNESTVELSVYNILGEKICTLFNGVLAKGRHLFRWNGRSAGGALMPSGVYFYQLQVQGGARLTKKMILMR